MSRRKVHRPEERTGNNVNHERGLPSGVGHPKNHRRFSCEPSSYLASVISFTLWYGVLYGDPKEHVEKYIRVLGLVLLKFLL